MEFVFRCLGGFFHEALAAEDRVTLIPEPRDAEASGGFEFVKVIVEFAAFGFIADQCRGGQALEEFVEFGNLSWVVAFAFFKKVE